jgi:hypothetical protein
LPEWRNCKDEIELIQNPSLAWIESVDDLRFSVMASGDIIFGNAEHVMHADIMRVSFNTSKRNGRTNLPVLVGYMPRNEEKKLFINILQYFSYDPDLGYKFLGKLFDWKDFCTTIGYVPENKHGASFEI